LNLVRRFAGAARLLATGKLALSTGFDGAQMQRRLVAWRPGSESINRLILQGCELQRAPARQLVRTNPYASQRFRPASRRTLSASASSRRAWSKTTRSRTESSVFEPAAEAPSAALSLAAYSIGWREPARINARRRPSCAWRARSRASRPSSRARTRAEARCRGRAAGSGSRAWGLARRPCPDASPPPGRRSRGR
jgi:hypothetical protein